MITLDDLKERLHYDPETGVFSFRKTGKVAGHLNKKSGYVTIRLDGISYYAHRLAWFYMKGEWPERADHENNNRSDNKWTNIREATQAQNNRNGRKREANKSGFKGVSWNSQSSKWKASITFNRKQETIGQSDCPIEAARMYDERAIELHGEFAKTNVALGLLKELP
ncbi:hypothetical protein [Burkholderia phage vB_BpP_HN04]|nr:endonuclease [Burkholderia phage vB_BpP_HN01]